MSNPFQLNFTLKQHTPIIHFQHEQEGATLRATEVKPKLDRFIMEKLTGKIAHEAAAEFKRRALLREGEDAKPEWKNWLVGKGKSEHVALEYRMRIEAHGVKFLSADGMPLFFGNTGPGNQKKYKLSMWDSGSVCIRTFNPTLKQQLENTMCKFFAQTNFGTRQSKGYGSFYPDKKSDIFHQIPFSMPSTKFSFTVSNGSIKEVFSQLELFYLSLRGGINRLNNAVHYSTTIINGQNKITAETGSRFYFKSLLFLYVSQHLKLQWEKKTIKEQYLNTTWSNFGRKIRTNENRDQISAASAFPPNQITDETRIYQSGLTKQQSDYSQTNNPVNYSQASGQKYIFKDLFGLSTSESWGSYGFTLNKKHSRQLINNCNPLADKDSSRINRFQSPLFFKILKEGNEFRVYLKINSIPSGYIGEWFSLLRGTNNSLCLPIYHLFDFNAFFQWIFDPVNFNCTNHVRSAMQNEEEFKVLKNIFEQLQKP